MTDGYTLAALLLLFGAIVLVVSWVVHWVLIIAGVGLVLLAIYVAAGGQLPGL